jgi:ribonuclease R
MAGFKQMVHDLALKGPERRRLEELLRELTRHRKLVAIGKDRWSLPTAASTRDLVAGRLRMHRDGYGFVTPDPDSLPARAQGKLAGDIFIPPPAIGNAMDGDQVLVELGQIRDDGKAEGRILRVVDRQHQTVVGKFHYGHRYNYVTPSDEKLTVEIVIPPGMERPRESEGDRGPSPADRDARHPDQSLQQAKTGLARDPDRAPTPKKPRRQSRHRVLGEEVKRRTDDDLEGMVVEVKIIQWPSATERPRGRVVEILGHEDDFGVDVEIVIRKHHIRHVFPDNVLDEAQAVSPVITHRQLERRADYRELPIVTIDGETARDFDDAVLVRRLANGHYELHVHIADVAHYVEEGSAIDREARLRGTSVYFPDRAVPMLPLELSTDICSLRPDVERLVLSCVMEIDSQGDIRSYELAEGVIRSARRMTYTDVNAIIEGDADMRRRYGDLAPNFDLMYELAQILNRKRVKRGSIDFDLPEPVIEFDDWGLMKSISPSERNWAHRLIEEFMLAANETVAGHLEQRVASIYRIHEKPNAKRVYEFETIAASFGYSLGVGALPIKRVQMRSDKRAHYGSGRRPTALELPEEVHVTPRMYQKLTQKIAGKPEERILSYLMLRSLKQARYSEVNEGHFALAAPVYTHFTSPIRRYPDLIVHRILKWVLRESGEENRLHAPEHRALPWSSERGAGREMAGGEMKDRRKRDGRAHDVHQVHNVRGPIPEETLHDIAESSSQTERAADDAERELLEWKKAKFMQDRLGEEFDGLIVSVTRFGFFVELTDLFIEGLVPLDSLEDDRYTYRENTRQIIGDRTRKTYSIGDKVRVLVDRIEQDQHRIIFAVVEEKVAAGKKGKRRRR